MPPAQLTSPTKFISAGRTRGADGSIHLEAIWRSFWPGLGMLAGAIGAVGMVVSKHPVWLAGIVLTPLALLGVRKRSIECVAGSRLLRISDSGGLRARDRFLPFDELRDLRLIAGPSASGPSLLSVND